MRAVTRTQDEIVARLESENFSDDLFGKRREVLCVHLDWAHAQPYAAKDCTEEMWGEPATFAESERYLEFTVGKILGERGLSVGRSAQAFQEYVWLYCDDATYEEYVNTDYGWYGRTQIGYAARQLGLGELFDRLLAAGD
jgi:hypothetical protein